MSEAAVHVDIFDTTLRDGAQSLAKEHQFPVGSKPEIADHIAEFGAGIIEAGFPTTPGDLEQVRDVARFIGAQAYRVDTWRTGEQTGHTFQTPVIAGLSRSTRGDIEQTWEAVQDADRPRIHVFISTDDRHMAAKFPGKSPEQVLKMGCDAIDYAREISAGNPNATVEFSAEAASTTNPVFLERVVKSAVGHGADVINMPDTVGEERPLKMAQFYRNILHWVHTTGNAIVSAHDHDDGAMAVANSLALVEVAAEYAAEHGIFVGTQIETTVYGIGERAGNANVYPVVAGLHKFSPDYAAPVSWSINPHAAVRSAHRVMGYAGIEIDPSTPIIGRDTFVHRSGIHSHGVERGGFRIYTPHDPRFWGHRESARYEDGMYQGKAGRDALAA